MKGLLVIISAPSGAGKTTVIKTILARVDVSWKYSISMTTRPPRPGEVRNRDYYFVTSQEFLDKVARGELVEWNQVHGYYYGTPKENIDAWLKEGKTVLLDVDVYGALEVKRKYPQSSVSIFIAPPSIESLVERLKNRSTDSDEEIAKRLKRVPDEMEQSKLFDYIVVNHELEDTVTEVMKIISNHLK